MLSASEVVYLTAMKGLIALEVLLPLALYVAVLLGLGRLYSDSEMDAFRGAGVSEQRLLRPVMGVAIVLAIGIACLTTIGRPWAYAQTYALKIQAEASSDIDRIKAGRFYSFEDNAQTVLIENIAANGEDLRGVFVSRRREGSLLVISAQTGVFKSNATDDGHQLVLTDATIYKKTKKAPNFLGKFPTLSIWLHAHDAKSMGFKPKAEPTASLGRVIDPQGKAEFQWRLSTPISTLLLALLAVPMSRSRPRQGRFAKLLMGVLVYAAYYNLLGVSRTWVEQQVFGYIWWVPALLALLVTYLYVPWSRWFNISRAQAAHEPD